MLHSRMNLGVLVLAVSASLVGSVSQADLISVSFQGSGDHATSGLDAGDLTGLFSAENWNNVAGQSGSQSGLNLSDGSASTVDLTSFNGPAGDGSGWVGNATPFSTLFNGGFAASQWFNPADFSLSGLLSLGSSYDLTVYYSGGEAWAFGRKAALTVGVTDYYIETRDNSGAETYIQAASITSGTYDQGNYVLFSGLSGDTQTATLHDLDGDIRIVGFQIQTVAVPEPSTFLLGSLIMSIVGLRFAGRHR